MLNHNLITCAKAEILDSSELFSYTAICSSFKWTEPLYFELPVYTDKQTPRHQDSQTPRHTDTQTDMSTP